MSQAFRVKRFAPHRIPSRTPAADRVACIEIANRNLRKQRAELRQKVAATKRTKRVLKKDLDTALELLRNRHAEVVKLNSSLGTLMCVTIVLGLGVSCEVLLLVFV